MRFAEPPWYTVRPYERGSRIKANPSDSRFPKQQALMQRDTSFSVSAQDLRFPSKSRTVRGNMTIVSPHQLARSAPHKPILHAIMQWIMARYADSKLCTPGHSIWEMKIVVNVHLLTFCKPSKNSVMASHTVLSPMAMHIGRARSIRESCAEPSGEKPHRDDKADIADLEVFVSLRALLS